MSRALVVGHGKEFCLGSCWLKVWIRLEFCENLASHAFIFVELLLVLVDFARQNQLGL